MVGEGKSHAHSHIHFPPTKTSFGQNAQSIPGVLTTILNLFCLYSSLVHWFITYIPSFHPSSDNSIRLQGLLTLSFLQPSREIRMRSTNVTSHGKAFLTRQLGRATRKHGHKETPLFFIQACPKSWLIPIKDEWFTGCRIITSLQQLPPQSTFSSY